MYTKNKIAVLINSSIRLYPISMFIVNTLFNYQRYSLSTVKVGNTNFQ